jgi:hypothetical protein
MYYLIRDAYNNLTIATPYTELEAAQAKQAALLEQGYTGLRVLIDIETADANLEAAAAAPRRLTVRGKAGYGNWDTDGEAAEEAEAAALR